MAEAIVRKYRRRDRDAILEITAQSFGGACLDSNIEQHFGAIARTTWQERKQRGIDHDLRHNARHVLVAELDGLVVGYVCTRVYRDMAVGHLANMAVARQYQGRGIGKMLIRASLDHFRRLGLKYARIETLEQNATGRHLYPAFGFKEVGRQIFFFREL